MCARNFSVILYGVTKCHLYEDFKTDFILLFVNGEFRMRENHVVNNII
jgi:hypothetical protein